MLTTWPGLAAFLADGHAIKRLPSDRLLRAKPALIDETGAFSVPADMQMLTRVLESPAARAAMAAQGFPLMLFR